jgi:hypothetical protein
MLMCRFKNIPDILFNKPTLFSEYTDMVNVLSSMFILVFFVSSFRFQVGENLKLKLGT